VHQPRDLTGLHDLIAIGTHPDPRTEPPPDLAAQVRALLRLTTTSVPSCSGVRLSLTRDNLPVTVTALTLDAGLEPVRSSLAIRLPHNPLVHSALTNSTSLPPGRSLPAGAELVLYASCRRAFHTVAVDLLALLDLDPRRAVLDRHLALPDLADAADTLAAQLDDCSAVERAVGVLLARGLSVGQGRQELTRRAAAHGHDLPAAARQLLRTLPGPATGHTPGDHRRDPKGQAAAAGALHQTAHRPGSASPSADLTGSALRQRPRAELRTLDTGAAVYQNGAPSQCPAGGSDGFARRRKQPTADRGHPAGAHQLTAGGRDLAGQAEAHHTSAPASPARQPGPTGRARPVAGARSRHRPPGPARHPCTGTRRPHRSATRHRRSGRP